MRCLFYCLKIKEGEIVKEWCLSHPWMTFIIIISILETISALICRKDICLDNEDDFIPRTNIHTIPSCQSCCPPEPHSQYGCSDSERIGYKDHSVIENRRRKEGE